MITEELFRKIRRIEIISRKTSQEVFAGQYHSAFKGRGMEFSEVREYQPGDDIRFIDWNVSSRMGKLFVKQFVEERELTVILGIDLSASLNFLSLSKSKKEISAEISALIAFTAMLNNDKVGLLIFTDRVEYFIPPKKGRTHLLRMIREILEFQPTGRLTDLENGLAYLNRVIKKKAILFLISDFRGMNFNRALKISARKHDVIAINISDPRELDLPQGGLFILRDAESGDDFMVDFSDRESSSAFANRRETHLKQLDELFKSHRIDYIRINDENNYEKPLFNLFLERRKKLLR